MAYHSSNPSDPDVYHDDDDCPTGQQILKQIGSTGRVLEIGRASSAPSRPDGSRS